MATLIKVGSKWYSDLRMGDRRIRRALSTDRRIAQRMLDEMVEIRRSQRYSDIPKDMTIDFFRTRHKEIIKNKQTMYRDELAFRMLKASLPVTHLRQITPELLDRLKTKWAQEGKSVSTIARALHVIKASMRIAEGWKYVPPQPWHMVKIIEPKGRLRWWTQEEVGRLLAVCEGHWLIYAMLLSRAGLRPSEAYHMEWSDVNFLRHSLWIHAKEGWRPKGGKERYVPIHKDLEAFLQGLPDRTGFVLGADRPTLGTMDVFFRRLVKRAKLTGSAYTLRHTFASHMVSNGASLEAVGAMMGHSDPKTTQIYAHLAPEALESAIKLLPGLSSGLVPVPAEQEGLRVI